MNSDRTRRQWLAAYLLLLVGLILTSSIRFVGDGGEYLEMAVKIAALPPPSTYAHFWFYSALAAPFVQTLRLFGLQPLVGFTLLNVALIGAAFWVASRALDRQVLLLLFVSPVVWWIDKAHTEVFTFSLLTMAVVILHEPGVNTGWAVLCLGVAGTQNPPIAAFAVLLSVMLLAARSARLTDRRFVVLSGAGLAAAALPPAYYWFRSSTLFPLAKWTHRSVPNIDELFGVVRDSNIGLVANAPLLVLAVGLTVGFLIVRSPKRLLAVDVGFSLATAAMLLVTFAETTNFNHGGTPGMSRYALWLIPLTVPFLRRFDELAASNLVRGAAACLVLASVLWSLVAFHPRWPQGGGQPTWVAAWLWSNHPALDRPLPEVFVERLRGRDMPWFLPVATQGCEKILFEGRGPDVPIWPIPCVPTFVPARCRQLLVMCYANRHGTTYTFAQVPAPSFRRYLFNRDGVWTEAESQTVGVLLQRLRWWDMRVCGNEVVRGSFGVNQQHNYCANDRLFVYLKNVQPGATINLRLPARMSGSFRDAATGEEVEPVAYDGEPGALWTLAVPVRHASLALVITRPQVGQSP